MVTKIDISDDVESDEMRGKTVPGTSDAFVYDHPIPPDVHSHGAGDDMKVTPEHQSRQAQASLTQQQDGAITKTNPYSQFDSDWYLNARPVVTMQPVDAHAATAQSVVPATATEGDVT